MFVSAKVNSQNSARILRIVAQRRVSTTVKVNTAAALVRLPALQEQVVDGSSTYNDRAIKSASEIPGPAGLPYIGSLLNYKLGKYGPDDHHKSLLDKYRKYGDIFQETVGGETIIHMFNTEYARQILSQGGKMPTIPPLLEPLKRYRKSRGVGLGLGNTNDAEWYDLRSRVNSMMLQPRAVSAYLPNVNKVMDEYIDSIEKKVDPISREIPAFNNEMVKLSMEIAGHNTFEKRFGILNADKNSIFQALIHANDVLFDCSTKLKFSMKWYEISPHISLAWNKLISAEDYFMKFVKKETEAVIEQIKDRKEDGSLSEKDYPFFMTLLGMNKLSAQDVYVMSLSMFSDGLTSIPPAMVYMLYCLANNPEKQDKLCDEIKTILPADKQVTTEVLANAPYLKACVKETFRMFPLQPDISRISKEDVVVGGYHIKKGTHVQLNMNVILREEEVFQKAEKYIPERWLRGVEKQEIDSHLFLPFSHGARMCIGRRIAEQEMYVHIVKLLDRYRVSRDSTQVLEQQFKMLFRPKTEANIKFSLR